jgi:outer membrane protein insertion porin family
MQNKGKYRMKISALILMALTVLLHPHSGPGPAEAADHNELLTGQTISEIAIEISGVKEETLYWEQKARDLISVNAQDGYSLEKIERAVSRLVESNLFQSIHVEDPVKTPQGVRLSFLLTPFGRIKDIVIRGAFPLFHREILNAVSLRTGDAFSREKLDEQVLRVTNLFKEEGYTDPRVKIAAQKDEADGNYTILMDIEKKDYFKIDRVEFKGNRNISDAVLKLRINTWKASVLFAGAGRFVQKELNEDIRTIISAYRQKGFADVRAEAETVRDEAQRKLDIFFHIQEGPKYAVSFQGNNHFFDFTLKKEIRHLFKTGNKNNFGIRRAVRNLKRLYGENGYPDAVIEFQVKDDDPVAPLNRHVTLKIEEGRPYRVTKLEFSGNKAVPENEILKTLLTRPEGMGRSASYAPDILDEDIRAIIALYHGKGFNKIRVEKEIKIQKDPPFDQKGRNSVEIRLLIEEGVQTLVDEIDLRGLTAFSSDMALSLMQLGPDMGFDVSLVETDEKNLQEKISEAGYPHAVVKAQTAISPDGSRVSLSYDVMEGPRVKTGQIIYSGNFRTKEKILSNEMEIRTGEPLLLSDLLESQRKVRAVNAIDSARLIPVGLKTKDEEVDIVVETTEKKPYAVEAGVGFDTERHAYVTALAGDRNFMGRNLDTKAEAEMSQVGYKLDASLTEPRFLSTLTASTTRLFAEDREEFNKDFGTRMVGVSQDFSRPFLDRKLTANLGFIYEYREQYASTSRILTEAEKESYNARSIFITSTGLVFRTTDSHIRPTAGIFSTLNLDISKGIENDLDDYIKYQVEGRYYYTPAPSLTFAVRGRYGFIQPYGGNTHIPEDQLFYLGGASTVRGFDENLLRTDGAGQAKGGREAVLGSLEARYDLGMNLDLSLFYDIGTVAMTQDSAISESFRDSVGIGLRYMTPVGPIGFMYGHKLDPEPHESPGSFHFSMGYTF